MSTQTIKSTIKTEVVTTEDRTHRYVLRKEWDKDGRKLLLIMIYPSTAGELLLDNTTMYAMNNIVRLGYGSVEIANMFSKVGCMADRKSKMADLTNPENDAQILKSATKADDIVFAWGKVDRTLKLAKERQEQIMALLEKYRQKIYVITSDSGGGCFHPLAPQVRHSWHLLPIDQYCTEEQANPAKETEVSEPEQISQYEVVI